MKYFILKRNNSKMLMDYLMEFDGVLREKLEVKLDAKADYLLIEKNLKNDGEETIETFKNLITFNEMDISHIYKITKKNKIWDYTGIVHPLIHVNKQIYTFEQYMDIK